MSIIDRVGPIIDTVMGANQGRRDKQRRRENALMGTSIALGLIGNFKRNKYLDKADQASIDQWIARGKIRNEISELKQEKEALSGYTKALAGVDLTKPALVENAIGPQVWQETVYNNESLRESGKAADYPTYQDFLKHRHMYSADGQRKIKEAYDANLQNTLERVKTGKKVDLVNLEAQFKEIEANKINTDFIENASLLNLFTGKTEKRLQRKLKAFDSFSGMYLSDPIEKNAMAFNALRGSKNLTDTKAALKNHQFSDVTRLPNETLNIISIFPPEEQKKLIDMIESNLQTEEILKDGVIDQSEVERVGYKVVYNTMNPTEGVKASAAEKAQKIRAIYDSNISDEEKAKKIEVVNLDYENTLNFFSSITDMDTAKKAVAQKNSAEGVLQYIEANNLDTTDPQLANIMRRQSRLWESGLDSVSQNILRKQLDAELSYITTQRYADKNDAKLQREAEDRIISLIGAGKPYNAATVNDLVRKNPELQSDKNLALKRIGKGSRIFWTPIDANDNNKNSPYINDAFFNQSVRGLAQAVNPELNNLIETVRDSNTDAFDAMRKWYANTRDRIDILAAEQEAVGTFGPGITLNKDFIFRQIVSDPTYSNLIGFADDSFTTAAGHDEALSEKMLRSLAQQYVNTQLGTSIDAKRMRNSFGLNIKGGVHPDIVNELNSLNKKEAANKVNSYVTNILQEYDNDINITSEQKEEQKENVIDTWENFLQDNGILISWNENNKSFNSMDTADLSSIERLINETENQLKQTRKLNPSVGPRAATENPMYTQLEEKLKDLNSLDNIERSIDLYQSKPKRTSRQEATLNRQIQKKFEIYRKYNIQ